jgi:putative aldouronate transport system permease protein
VPGREGRGHASRKTDRRLDQLLLFAVPLAHLFFFGLLPLYGVTMAFKEFSFARGLFSPWNGLDNYRFLLETDPGAMRILGRTALLGAARAVLLFAVPLGFVLVLDTFRRERFKMAVLLFLLLPQFVSWVAAASIFRSLFALDGPVNRLLVGGGVAAAPVAFFSRPGPFLVILFVAILWRDLGLYALLGHAALSTIPPALFEAAALDGAPRHSWAAVWRIKLPLIRHELVLIAGILLLSFASGPFEAVFNLYNPALYPYVDIVDTYVYRTGIAAGRFSIAAAIELLKNVMNLLPSLVFLVVVYRRMLQRRSAW